MIASYPPWICQPCGLRYGRLRGDCTGLYGDCSSLRGDCSSLYGDCTGLRGDCSSLYGDCTSLSGNLNDCDIAGPCDIEALVEG